MLTNLINELNSYSSIGVFGFGKEGKSFYNFATKYLTHPNITIIDQNNGENYLDDLSKVDLIIKSPGISLHQLNIKYNDYNFTSISELFIKYFSKQIIGITGTKGKSTLATLLYDLLKNNQQDAILCGNIGLPVFDILEKITNNTTIIIELSSHQLFNIKYSPHIAVLTNIFQDHLDYYTNYNEYYNTKLNIFKYQKENDVAIINSNDNINNNILKANKIIYFNRHNLQNKISFDFKKGFIHHQTLQILEIFLKIFNINDKIYLKTIKEFKTLPHRLEYVGNINGIEFINDSISTIPEATIKAIELLPKIDTLILGGFDRGIDYTNLAKYLDNSDIRNIILYSQTGLVLKKLFNTLEPIYTNDLKSAVIYAKNITNKNSICLFSPAASSFDEFKNFEQRGEKFKNYLATII